MKDDGLGRIFLRHLVISIPWAITFLVVLFVAGASVKQEVKEGIQYATKIAVNETAYFATKYNTIVPVKQNVKEGIEFAAKTVKDQVKDLLSDPEFKQDLKEALEFAGKKLK